MLNLQLNEFQKFVKNIFFKLTSSLYLAVINILIISYLSESLHVDGFGKFNFLTTYCTYFTLLISLGTDVVAVRTIAVDRSRLKEVLGTLIPLRIFLSIIVFLLMISPVLYIEKFTNYGIVLIAFSSSILITPLTLQFVFDATKRLQFTSIILIIAQSLNYYLLTKFINRPDDLIYVGFITLTINTVIALSQNLIVLKLYGKWNFKINFQLWKKFLKSGLVIGFIQITIMMIHYFDIFMLGFMKTDRDVGLYSAAYKLMFFLISFLGIFHSIMNPILFDNFKNNIGKFNKHFNLYFKFMVFLGLGTTVIFIFLAKPYLAIFFDLNIYNESITCFKILMLSLLFITINSPLHIGLLAAEKEKIIVLISVIQLTINIIGNLLLIPEYGIIGSSVATVITEIFGIIFYIYFFRKIIIIVKPIKNFVTALISLIPMSLFLHYSKLHYLLNGIIAVAIMIFFVILLRGYTINEIKNLKKDLQQ